MLSPDALHRGGRNQRDLSRSGFVIVLVIEHEQEHDYEHERNRRSARRNEQTVLHRGGRNPTPTNSFLQEEAEGARLTILLCFLCDHLTKVRV